MQVRLGAPVFGVDGKRIGEVEALIANAGTKRARAILVDEGLLDRAGHMVAVSAITRSDHDGVHLEATGPQSEEDAPVLASEEVALEQRVAPPTTFIPAAGVGGPVIASDPAVPGEYPNDPSFFDIAPIDPPPVEIESNLEENEVRLGRGTDAMSADRHKIGAVASFDLGDLGLIEGITVSEGLLFKHSQQFSLSDIAEIDSDAIHLRVTRGDAEKH